MTDLEIIAKFNELTAAVKSKHLAVDILALEAAMNASENVAHAQWCSFFIETSKQCDCGRDDLMNACELRRQVESGER